MNITEYAAECLAAGLAETNIDRISVRLYGNTYENLPNEQAERAFTLCGGHVNQDMISDADTLASAHTILQKYTSHFSLPHLSSTSRSLFKAIEMAIREQAEPLETGTEVTVWSASGDDAWDGKFIRYDGDGLAWVELDGGDILDGIDPSQVTRA